MLPGDHNPISPISHRLFRTCTLTRVSNVRLALCCIRGNKPALDDDDAIAIDELARRRCQTLLSVDDSYVLSHERARGSTHGRPAGAGAGAGRGETGSVWRCRTGVHVEVADAGWTEAWWRAGVRGVFWARCNRKKPPGSGSNLCGIIVLEGGAEPLFFLGGGGCGSLLARISTFPCSKRLDLVLGWPLQLRLGRSLVPPPPAAHTALLFLGALLARNSDINPGNSSVSLQGTTSEAMPSALT